MPGYSLSPWSSSHCFLLHFSLSLWPSDLPAGPEFARLVRGEFLRIKNEEFASWPHAPSAQERVVSLVILPNAIPTLLVSATMNIGTAILFEAASSYLGLGDPSVMSWGLIISNNRGSVFDCWWAIALPGLAIFIIVLAICLIGDGLTDALNPKLREI